MRICSFLPSSSARPLDSTLAVTPAAPGTENCARVLAQELALVSAQE